MVVTIHWETEPVRWSQSVLPHSCVPSSWPCLMWEHQEKWNGSNLPTNVRDPLGFNFSLPKPESWESWVKVRGPLFPQDAHMCTHICALCVRKLREADVRDMCHPTFKSPSSFEYSGFLLGQFALCVILVGGQFLVTAISCRLPPWKLTEATFFLSFVREPGDKHMT